MRPRPGGNRGNATLELTLIFLPMMLMILALIDVGRGMWIYHTLSSSVKRGARMASVKGTRCYDSSTACRPTLNDLVRNVEKTSIGLDPAQLSLTLTAGTDSRNCQPASSCHGNTTVWPPKSSAGIGMLFKIRGTYTFRPLTAMLWPVRSGQVALTSESTEVIHF